MDKFREEIRQEDSQAGIKRQQEDGYKSSTGYGGKFGVQKDRMDKSAMGHDFIAKVDKHDSQKDYKTGFGASLVCRPTEWTSLPWGGSMWRGWTSITVNKIIKMVLVESLVFKPTGWTNQLWGGSTMKRLRSMSLRQITKLA